MVGLGIYGPGGYVDLQSKREYLAELERNNARLETLQAELTNRMIRAETSSELLQAKAHSLGYVGPNQVLVRIQTKPDFNQPQTSGTILKAPTYRAPPRSMYLGAGAAAALLSLLMGMIRPGKAKQPKSPASTPENGVVSDFTLRKTH
ncbi:hypothetical protein DC28_11190 [Spirochaeta lutea]|uniref:Septum formation initiator n=2 Tax=Spirochaeta lutea TaxID=1480694 RepID=A0A098QV01_9SPIO|nr:hypothetical protein DC28_11190 [Spirochaeta lutea]